MINQKFVYTKVCGPAEYLKATSSHSCGFGPLALVVLCVARFNSSFMLWITEEAVGVLVFYRDAPLGQISYYSSWDSPFYNTRNGTSVKTWEKSVFTKLEILHYAIACTSYAKDFPLAVLQPSNVSGGVMLNCISVKLGLMAMHKV